MGGVAMRTIHQHRYAELEFGDHHDLGSIAKHCSALIHIRMRYPRTIIGKIEMSADAVPFPFASN